MSIMSLPWRHSQQRVEHGQGDVCPPRRGYKAAFLDVVG